MKHTRELLKAWIDYWEQNYGVHKEKELRKFLFERSFINVCQATVSIIEEKFLSKLDKPIQRSSSDWLAGFLKFLESAFTQNAPIIAIFTLEYPLEMGRLRQELRAGAFDLRSIYPLLLVVRSGMSASTVGANVTEEFQKEEAADFQQIQRLTIQLIRSHLGMRNHFELRDILRNTVSEVGARHFLSTAPQKLTGDSKLSKALWQEHLRILMALICEPTIIDPIIASRVAPSERGKGHFNRRVSGLYAAIATEVGQHLNRPKEEGITSNVVLDLLDTDKNLHDKVGMKITGAYIQLYVREIINAVMASPRRDARSDLSIAMLKLGDFLARNFQVRINRPKQTQAVYPDLVVTEAFAFTAASRLADNCRHEWMRLANSSVGRAVGRAICNSLTGRLRQDGEWEKLTAGGHSYLENWAVSKDTIDSLGPELEVAETEILRRLPMWLKSKTLKNSLNTKRSRLGFWNSWLRSVIGNARFSGRLHSYFPWHRVGKNQLRKVFAEVFGTMDLVPDDWSVYFTINGLDSKKTVWEMGGITFFDPSYHLFKSPDFMRVQEDRITTVARVDVKASGSFDASKRAWRKLSPILDQPAFVLSLNKTYGGFAVEVDPYVFAERPRTKTALGSRQLDRGEVPVRTQSIDEIIAFVEPLSKHITEKVRRGSTLTNLEQRYVASVHWYNKGRWQADPADTYVYYWIAIEALFPSAGQQELFESVACITRTWQQAYGYGWTMLLRHRADLVRMLEEDSETAERITQEPRLQRWDSDLTTLLDQENVLLLRSLIPQQDRKRTEYAEKYFDFLMEFAANRDAYEDELRTLREEYRFKLFLLKALRNDIIHGGVHDHPSFLLYSDELQDVIELLLQNVGNAVINDSRRIRSIDDLLIDVEKWWVR